MIVRFLRSAEDEAQAAAFWYEQQQSGLGDDFYNELQSVLQTVMANAQSLPKLEDYTGPFDIRRCRFRRFQYFAIIRCLPEETIIVAIAHLHRRPMYWLDRLT